MPGIGVEQSKANSCGDLGECIATRDEDFIEAYQ